MSDSEEWRGFGSSGEDTRAETNLSPGSVLSLDPPEPVEGLVLDSGASWEPWFSEELRDPHPRVFGGIGDIERMRNDPRPLVPEDDWVVVERRVKAQVDRPAPRPAHRSNLPKRFPTCEAYRNHFQPILLAELEAGRAALNSILQQATLFIELESEVSFRVPTTELFSCGDMLYLNAMDGTGSPEQGTITNIDDGRLYLKYENLGERLEYVSFAMSYVIKKMLEALEDFSPQYPLASVILGNVTDTHAMVQVSPYSNPFLNSAQNRAITNALMRNFSLIQGPPGTGKTQLAARLVCELVESGEKVLVCASSNVAADQLSLAIHDKDKELRIMRLYSHEKEKNINPEISSFAFHYLLRNELIKAFPEYELRLSDLENPTRKRIATCLGTSAFEARRLADNLIQTFSVVCCTCVTAANRLLVFSNFDTVIIDEAAFSAEPETLLAIKHRPAKIVLIGDPQQLPPVVVSTYARENGYGRSLFERLMSCGMEPTMLNLQYRMHPVLSAFPRRVFYAGKLRDDEVVLLATYPIAIARFFREGPLVMINCRGSEFREHSSFSYKNEEESIAVAKVLIELFEAGVRGWSIGVISAYDAHRRLILEKMDLLEAMNQDLGAWFKMVEVKNLDAYQGREKDVIIISTVRANREGNIGFLSDKRRINVALTRAKYGLVLVGSQEVLRGNAIWKSFIEYGLSVGNQREAQ